MPHTRPRRALARLAGLLLLVSGLQYAAGSPAQAGQVGVTIAVRGAGSVTVVEGSLEDGGATVCDWTSNQDHRVTHTCPRVRNSEAFEAWVWLRPTPAAAPRGEWRFSSWEGCDETRTRDGVEECAVHSGAFTSDERRPTAVFRDVVAPVVQGLKVLQVAGTNGLFQFEFDAGGAGTVCGTGPTELTPCTSPHRRFLSEGTYTFHVRGEDASGNVGSSATVPVVAVDTLLWDRPPVLAATRSAAFSFTSGTGDSFFCSLDGAPATICGEGESGALEYHSLAEGNHSFTVFARKGDFRDLAPSGHAWTVDTTAPQTAMVGAVTSGRTASFTFDSPESRRTECRLTVDDVPGPWATCTSPAGWTGLADGAYFLEVRGVDHAGNVESDPAYHAWTVDGTAPRTTLTGGPAQGAFVLSDAAHLALASDEPGATFDCTVDARPAPCSAAGLVLSRLSRATHVVTATATDARGNVDASPAVRAWTVPLLASELRRGRGWTAARSPASYGGRVAQATRKGAVLTREVRGARRLALVVGKGRGHGSVKVYAGTRLLRTVDLASRRTLTRQLVVLPSLNAPFSGTVRIVTTSTRPVRIEGLGVATR